MSNSKAKSIGGWVAQVVLALLFAAGAAGKLTQNPQVIKMFEDWGFPANFFLVIGVLELLGAIGLLIPRTAGYAALGLFGIMIGAVFTHFLNGEGAEVLRPILFMLVLAVVLWVRRPWPFRARASDALRG